MEEEEQQQRNGTVMTMGIIKVFRYSQLRARKILTKNPSEKTIAGVILLESQSGFRRSRLQST